ncbi:MAG: dTMP kinase [bacterium]
MGLFVTFEGIEGAGKTTQLDRVEAFLKEMRLEVFRTREPGGTSVGESVRSILLSVESGCMDPMTELLLIQACRAELIRRHLRPRLEAGVVVLCDRFTDATLAYQGYGRGIDLGLIDQLNEIATGGIRPDLTILLDCPVEVGFERIRNRRPLRGPDRLEAEGKAFHERVREGYLELTRRSRGRIRVVDSTEDAEKVGAKIIAYLRDALGTSAPTEDSR